MSTILAIETSCDETAVAVLRNDELMANEVASQVAVHRAFGGVVPEVASRNHLAVLPELLDRVRGKVELTEIDAFAATSGPGLASSLLVGNSTAKGLALGAGKPFLAINHLEGHLLSPFFGRKKIEPHIALVVSGGHTLLVDVRDVGAYLVLGKTVDDAAGEAFDKVAKLLGLAYPGGPEVERGATMGDSRRFDFPRGMADSGDLNFSFSGLKTAVRYALAKEASRDSNTVNDVCASFQAAVVEVLCGKSLSAVRKTGARTLALSGGVSRNEALRDGLRAMCQKNEIEFLVAAPWLSTDNAAMIAFAGLLCFERAKCSSLAEEIDPNLALA